jgi:hypothetical protein
LLIARDLPFASKTFEWCLYWHRRHQDNPASAWLRDRVVETACSIKST